MIAFRLHEYVEWLTVIENVELWTAKERAQKLYEQRTGQKIELHKIFSTSEIIEMIRIESARSKRKKQRR